LSQFQKLVPQALHFQRKSGVVDHLAFQGGNRIAHTTVVAMTNGIANLRMC
jgi:hypothetical protein